MKNFCSFSDNGYFRIHSFGQEARDKILIEEISNVFDITTESWDMNSGFIDLFIRGRIGDMNDFIVRWPDQISRKAFINIIMNVSSQDSIQKGYKKIMDQFPIEQYDRREKNNVQCSSSCFITDNNLLSVHLIGDELLSKLDTSLIFSEINQEASNLEHYLPGTTVEVIIEHRTSPITIGRYATGIISRIQRGNVTEPTYIRIGTDLSGSSSNVIRDILRTLRHELHHFRFFAAGNRADRLIDQLVYEGQAVAFEIHLDPDHTPIYSRAVEHNQLLELKNRVRPLLFNTDLYSDWMFGKGDIPRWAGYSLGYDMIKNYLNQHADKNPANLIAIPSETFLEYL